MPTALPWRIEEVDDLGICLVSGAANVVVAACLSEEDAEYIKRLTDADADRESA